MKRIAVTDFDPDPTHPAPTGVAFVPRPRTTQFSPSAGAPPVGLVPVVVAVGTGVILGAKLSRSGSWTRASSGG